MTPAESADRMRLIAIDANLFRAASDAFALLLRIAEESGHREAVEHYRFSLAPRLYDKVVRIDA